MAVHELGHCVALWTTGGAVERVVLHPLAISRTDAAVNPSPLVTVWAGPVVGVVLPLAAWGLAAAARMPGSFVVRFVAGFCLVANSCYIGVGAVHAVGDAAEMLRLGTPRWCLATFGLVCVTAGLALWNGQGSHFGFGPRAERVPMSVALTTAAAAIVLSVVGAVFFPAKPG